jgi:sulfoxide reductase catalytic subunit YedY
MAKLRSAEITPQSVYLSRRTFMRVGALTSTLALAACSGANDVARAPTVTPRSGTPAPAPHASHSADEQGNALTSYEDATTYNNYYEFSPLKQEPAKLAGALALSPWSVQVSGLVHKPKTYDLDDLRRRFPAQERVYRLRCVEGWSMVIPWLGFPLNQLLKEVEPLSSASFVRFTSISAPEQMPRQNDAFYPWPYSEGLQISEAMHDLTLLATGLYGKNLPAQNGAPVRLVVPWKYGFKSAKAIVKIELVNTMPTTFWVKSNPREYGFYANVNPSVPHPRWPQSTERRIGQVTRIRTLPFNGYAEQVAHLYDGMDLVENY